VHLLAGYLDEPPELRPEQRKALREAAKSASFSIAALSGRSYSPMMRCYPIPGFDEYLAEERRRFEKKTNGS